VGRTAGIWPYVCLAPALLVFALVEIIPALATAVFSLTDYTALPNTPINFVGLENYNALLLGSRTLITKALQVSLVFSIAVTVLQNGFAVLVAWLLNTTLRGRILVRSVVFLPVVLGATINGLVWYVMFNPLSGPITLMINYVFDAKSNMLGNVGSALYAAIWVQIWANLGFSMMIFLAGMQGIPNEIYEAGKIDGTTAWQAFRKLTIPLLAPSITINVLLAVIGTLTTFELLFILTGGGPAFATQTLGLFVFNQAFYGAARNAGFAASIAMVQFAIVFAVAMVLQFYLRRREAVL